MATIKLHIDCLGDYSVGFPSFHGNVTINIDDDAIKEGNYNYKKIESDLIDYFQEYYDTPRVFNETDWKEVRKDEIQAGTCVV